jgi:ABC-type uncharacterized transport system permease subunit
MLWATVMMFRRSNQTQYIFDSMRMVRDNWQHYRNLYKIAQTNYRNDYALSIAVSLLSGHILGSFEAKYQMPTVMPDVKICQVSNQGFHLTFSRGDRESWLRIKDIDFHAMGKKHLGDLIASSN